MTQSKVDSCLRGFDLFVRQRMKDCGVPGLAIGIVKGERIIFAKGYGFSYVEKKLPMTEKTLFPIASNTKTFTATAVGILVNDGKLEWDKPIRKYIPWFKMYDPVATEKITIRDVLTHRSGMPRHILLKWKPSLTREELVRRLRYLKPSPSLDFRSKFRYATFMYAVAAFLIEYITGKTWEQFVKERIFKPLGMTASTFLPDVSMDEVAHGYEKRGKKLVSALDVFHKKVDFVTAQGAWACGPGNSIVSNVVDLCRWLHFQMNKGKTDKQQIISKQNLKEIHTPQIVVPGSGWSGRELLDNSYTMGWWSQPYRGHRWLWHGGGSYGSGNVISFMPSEFIGAVVWSNLTVSDPLHIGMQKSIILNIYDRLLGLKRLPWHIRAKKRTKELEIQGKQKAQKEKRKISHERKRGTRPSLPLKNYAGNYRHPGYGKLSITAERDRLLFQYEHLVLRFKHYHDDVFQMVKRGSFYYAPWRKAAFRIDKIGKIKSVAVSLVDLEPNMKVIFKRIKSKKE